MSSMSLAALMTLVLLAQPVSPGTPPFRGRLYAAASRWEPPNLDASADSLRVEPGIRPRFHRLVHCLADFRSGLPGSKDFFQEAARPHQRSLERALVCTGQGSRIASLASAYVKRATILYEWEGDYQAPLQESEFAERFIAANPRSPLLPYLHLFVAASQRHAFELLDGTERDAEMIALAAKYTTHLARAKAASPLVGLIADDLDGLAYLSRDVGKHPKDFR